MECEGACGFDKGEGTLMMKGGGGGGGEEEQTERRRGERGGEEREERRGEEERIRGRARGDAHFELCDTWTRRIDADEYAGRLPAVPEESVTSSCVT